jgi:hypothetical protein
MVAKQRKSTKGEVAKESRPKKEGKAKKVAPVSERLQYVIDLVFGGEKGLFTGAIEMAPTAIYKYLNGQRQPGADLLIRMARLGINIHWLITGEGSMFAPNKAGALLDEKYHNRLPATSISGVTAELLTTAGLRREQVYSLRDIAAIFSQLAERSNGDGS